VDDSTRTGVNASSRLVGGGAPKGVRSGLWTVTLTIIFRFVNSNWHILVNSEVLNLKYIIILGKYSH